MEKGVAEARTAAALSAPYADQTPRVHHLSKAIFRSRWLAGSASAKTRSCRPCRGCVARDVFKSSRDVRGHFRKHRPLNGRENSRRQLWQPAAPQWKAAPVAARILTEPRRKPS